MTTKELVELINRYDPRLETTIKIEAVGLRGGIGNSCAKLPSIELAYRGFDWESGMFVLRPTIKLKPVK